MAELRDRKIRVNVLTPGQVASPMLEAVMSPEMKTQFESVIPRREMGRPEEIASADGKRDALTGLPREFADSISADPECLKYSGHEPIEVVSRILCKFH